MRYNMNVSSTQMQKKSVFVLRRWRRGDAEAVQQLCNADMDDVVQSLCEGPWDNDLRAVSETYLQAHGEFIVGVLQDRIVGMGALRRVDEATAEIKRVRVDPTFRGLGLGREILTCLEDRARELGYDLLRVDASEQEVTQRFSRSVGYDEVAREPGPGGHEIVVYEKKL